ncbi:ABC transporter ATP-binding protein [Hoyosella sp. G463]|uniref:ABC transporter ATP-binding protein n=2 Tax=Lolliginicoccus lacisalsi TaxID=2742202 RepID=A0A927JBU5_9ACTN|nr:ABC transporter ATP-binding protein [Lolliginicoccus lacisalsi]MBD8506191.1 ABC transporter ATP-binding protein [Lolliginicoccus lacisalsi]
MLSVAGASARLGGREVLHGVDLDVGRGEWVTIIGPNGAGKSTLLRVITGLVRHGGEALIDGHRAAGLSARQRARLVATVAQSPIIPPGMLVRDYVLLGRTPHVPLLRAETALDHAATDDALAMLDLGTFARRRLDQLSGGERQRAFLARALAQDAPLLLLDEPTTALDISHKQDVLELVDELRRQRGLTVVSTMHDLSIAAQYADRMVLLARGTVVATGRPSEILTAPIIEQHYGASVQILPGPSGPVVAPIRPTSASRTTGE